MTNVEKKIRSAKWDVDYSLPEPALEAARNPHIEYWLPCPVLEGYDISSHGRVRSWWQTGRGSGIRKLTVPRIRKLTVDKHGRPTIRLRASEGQRACQHYYVSALVAFTFLGKPPVQVEYPVARHLDDVPSNNFVGNLAWGTQAENMQDRFVNAGRHCVAKLGPVEVALLRAAHANGSLHQTNAAANLGVHRSTVDRIVNGCTWNS